MPIVAAGIGLIGGLGGALVGGWLANEGQENQFESERAAAAQDLRLEEYGTFVGSAEEVALALLASSPDADIKEALAALLVAKARVFLVAGDNAEVGKAAAAAAETLQRAIDAHNDDVEEAKEKELEENYPDDRDHFLDVAQDDIDSARE